MKIIFTLLLLLCTFTASAALPYEKEHILSPEGGCNKTLFRKLYKRYGLDNPFLISDGQGKTWEMWLQPLRLPNTDVIISPIADIMPALEHPESVLRDAFSIEVIGQADEGQPRFVGREFVLSRQIDPHQHATYASVVIRTPRSPAELQADHPAVVNATASAGPSAVQQPVVQQSVVQQHGLTRFLPRWPWSSSRS